MKQLQLSLMVLATFILGHSAWASVGTLGCGGTDTKYQVTVDSTHREGQVTRDSHPIRFGNLQCADVSDNKGGEARLFLLCRSKDVADAGFNVLFETVESKLQAQLSEVWFGGIRHLETLSCREEE